MEQTARTTNVTVLNRKALSTLHRIMVAVVLVAVISGVAYSLGFFNRPPKAAFTYRTLTRTLRYIAPTDQDTIVFQNESSDTETPLEKLISTWYVRYNGTGDWKPLNSSTHYRGRLPVSNEKGHEIRLVVSDGSKEDSTSVTVPVDQATLYPLKRVGMRFKGVNYMIGHRFEDKLYPPTSELEMEESLEVIRNDLGCNAIKFVGDYEDVLVKAAEIAMRKRYEMIIISPRYWHKTAKEDYTIDEHVEKVVLFSQSAEKLREMSSTIVLCIGEELEFGIRGITNSSTYDQRVAEYGAMTSKQKNDIVLSKLRDYLSTMIREVRKYFHGKITYAHTGSTAYRFNYAEFDLDIVGPMLYWYPDERGFSRKVAQFRVLGKPYVSTEFGCHCWKGAMNVSGSAWQYYKDQEYSQEEQAVCIVRTMNIYLSNGLDGAFVFIWMRRQPNDARSYGIVRYYGDGKLLTRKLGFYAFQSFIVS